MLIAQDSTVRALCIHINTNTYIHTYQRGSVLNHTYIHTIGFPKGLRAHSSRFYSTSAVCGVPTYAAAFSIHCVDTCTARKTSSLILISVCVYVCVYMYVYVCVVCGVHMYAAAVGIHCIDTCTAGQTSSLINVYAWMCYVYVCVCVCCMWGTCLCCSCRLSLCWYMHCWANIITNKCICMNVFCVCVCVCCM